MGFPSMKSRLAPVQINKVSHKSLTDMELSFRIHVAKTRQSLQPLYLPQSVRSGQSSNSRIEFSRRYVLGAFS